MISSPRTGRLLRAAPAALLACCALLAGGVPAAVLASAPAAYGAAAFGAGGPTATAMETSGVVSAAAAGVAAAARPATATAAAAAAAARGESAEVQIVVIGDSLSTGKDTPGYPWTVPAQEQLDRDEVPADIVNSSVNGIGYVAQGSVGITFADLVQEVVTPQTGIVVLFGSDNDTAGSALTSAVAATLADVQRAAPDAEIVLVGPPATPANGGTDLPQVTATLRAGAAAAGAVFVDGTDWFGADPTAVLGSDGEHPDVAGEDELGHEFAALLAPIVTARRAAIASDVAAAAGAAPVAVAPDPTSGAPDPTSGAPAAL